MSLDPLHATPLVVQIHAYTAIAALLIGIIILAATKGTAFHKTLGRVWVSIMLVVALTSVFIRTPPGSDIPNINGYSVIHLLTVLTLVTLPYAIWRIRTGHRRSHAIAMISLFTGGLVVAGALTLVPGRVLHDVVFG
jgi:uncharacterized membrane protein